MKHVMQLMNGKLTYW